MKHTIYSGDMHIGIGEYFAAVSTPLCAVNKMFFYSFYYSRFA